MSEAALAAGLQPAKSPAGNPHAAKLAKAGVGSWSVAGMAGAPTISTLPTITGVACYIVCNGPERMLAARLLTEQLAPKLGLRRSSNPEAMVTTYGDLAKGPVLSVTLGSDSHVLQAGYQR